MKAKESSPDPEIKQKAEESQQNAASCSAANSQREGFHQYEPQRPLLLADCSPFENGVGRFRWGFQAASYLGASDSAPIFIDIQLRAVRINVKSVWCLTDRAVLDTRTAQNCMIAWPVYKDMTGAEKLPNGISGLSGKFTDPVWGNSPNQPETKSGVVLMTIVDQNPLTANLHSRDTDLNDVSITECGTQRFAKQQWILQIGNWERAGLSWQSSSRWYKDYPLSLRSSEKRDENPGLGVAGSCWFYEYGY